MALTLAEVPISPNGVTSSSMASPQKDALPEIDFLQLPTGQATSIPPDTCLTQTPRPFPNPPFLPVERGVYADLDITLTADQGQIDFGGEEKCNGLES
ncbi:MAG: hypothetical protein F6K44_31395 [Moorea sp. SIO3E2]|nr:hypothetical protein [Moorena sp. SIO3E2]